MPRNAGSDVDADAGRIRARDGQSYPLDRCVVAEGGLYCARPLAGSPLVSYLETWLLPSPGWVVNRFVWRPNRPERFDWYIEPDLIAVDGAIWRQRDVYLDLNVYEGVRYELDDTDEFAEAIAAGDIPLHEAVAGLHALDRLCKTLHRLGFSGQALLEEFAPGLPR